MFCLRSRLLHGKINRSTGLCEGVFQVLSHFHVGERSSFSVRGGTASQWRETWRHSDGTPTVAVPRVSARSELAVDDHKHVGSVLSVLPKNTTECNNRLSTSKSAFAFFLWFFFFVQTPTSPRNESDALRPRSFDPVSFTRHILEVSTMR